MNHQHDNYVCAPVAAWNVDNYFECVDAVPGEAFLFLALAGFGFWRLEGQLVFKEGQT